MFKFVLAFSGEIPSCRFYIATTSINQPVYRHQCGELAGGNSYFIYHLEELIQNYQNKKAPVLPGWFETSLSASKVDTMCRNDEIPGKEFVMNISNSSFSIPGAIGAAGKPKQCNVFQQKVVTGYT